MVNLSTGPKIMGIVNVTPDSFSDGGHFDGVDKAVEHGLKLLKDGADILDIGGESTRPGATPVCPQEEQKRILPVIRTLVQEGAFISVDTRHASTMKAAVEAGAHMINDVQALQGEGAMEAAAAHDGPVCLMHMKGQPGTMQNNPHYDDVVGDIIKFFECRIEACAQAGINAQRLILDPGIGFGKTADQNMDILKRLSEFNILGLPVLLGTSRKSFIEKIHNGASPDQRIGGSLASILWGYQQGVTIFRVHDVFESVQALKVVQRLSQS